jgi:hypothetical protein
MSSKRLSVFWLTIVFLLIALSSVAPRGVFGQCDSGCDVEYYAEGSVTPDGCSTDCGQLYCEGSYCDMYVTTCERSGGYSWFFSCDCYPLEN